MSETITHVLPQEYIDYFTNLPEVKEAKERIDRQSEGKIYFTVSLLPSIKSYLIENIGLDLKDANSIPMRWVKGDTLPHIDLCGHPFEKTYLAYLTDSTGELIVDGNSYQITKGSGYIFSEGMRHETVGTGMEPRLLLGPMSENGVVVGEGYTVNADGATDTIYIRYDSDLAKNVYKINNGIEQDLLFPLSIYNINIDPANNILKIIFTTDITLTNSYDYFVCGSDGIQFGSTSLNEDGTRPKIYIEDVPGYPGLIYNYEKNYIYIFNVEVRSTGSTYLLDNSGWIGHSNYGVRGTNNYIVNCLSDGYISTNGGGIVGTNASYGNGSASSSSLYIIGCSSQGNIGNGAGGIVGFNAAAEGGLVKCEKCWSTGAIDVTGGGIFGEYAASGESGFGGETIAITCYSLGAIAPDAGGIYGQNAGSNAISQAIDCYSQGSIGTNGGGIFGSYAGPNSGLTPAINCYSSGTIATTGDGIYGSFAIDDNAQNCYAANGGWTNNAANSALTGKPDPVIGTTWVYTGINQPYELNKMGYSPYSLTNIITTSSPTLNQEYIDTVQAGQTVTPAISGSTYTILEITDGVPASYGTITIPNSSTGVLVTTTATAPGTYTIYVRNTGSYNITIFGLIVLSSGGNGLVDTVSIPPCCQPICPQFNQTTNNTQEQLTIKSASIAIASDIDNTYLAINQNRGVNLVQPAFNNYRDYMTYLQSKYR